MPTVSSIAANDTAYLLFITDLLSGQHFLCDTGEQVRVLPASQVDKRLGEVDPPLEAANEGKIRTYGKLYYLFPSMDNLLHGSTC